MRFEYPKLLWLLLLVVPGLAAFFWWSARQRKRLMDQFVNPRLLEQLLSGISPQFQKIRAAMLIAVAALLVIAFARPQFGFDWEEVRQRGLDIVVAIDTSRSMLAEDVSPNRLTRAKLAAIDLRKIAKADRMGLVAFAGTAFLQCPLSSDDEAFRQSINELNVNIIPQGGTALADAINAARSAFKDKSDNHKILVLFTDGEDHDGQALDVAKEAAKEGLRIFTIGVGSDEGELLRITDARGRSDFIKDADGNVVKSRLDKALLMGIAKATEGFFLLLGGADTMDILYQRGLAPLPKAELASRQIQRYHERFQWLILSAIILLVAEMFVPERKRVVRPERRLQPAAVAALALLFLVPHSLMAASASKALKEYNSGKYERALHHFQDLLRDKPNDPRLNFNAGDAAFKWEMYEPALKHFNSALATEDLQLQQRAFYNLGNTHYRLGEQEKDPSKTKSNWEDAITSYESALKLNPNDPDAKFNLELVKKKLEELKQQQQQQKDDQKQDKSDDQKDQQNKDQQKQDKKDEQQQQQNKQDEQKKQQEQQKQQQQQQAQKPDDKKDDQQQAQSQPSKEEKKDGQEEQGEPLKKIKMTPQQAIRLLEAAKNDERTMIFIPPQKTNRTDRAFKDW